MPTSDRASQLEHALDRLRCALCAAPLRVVQRRYKRVAQLSDQRGTLALVERQRAPLARPRGM